ncbi:EF-hand domain-containing protein [Aliiroseovarius sediminis]|uniref:EF-hand domain-containing protein n=1 Tax=Aliiroseovarius sediminis TaxID=2925839 RepID=UPI001F57D360|nr:EF-hand domain-containing protein [Aliiroseovarius sediminis]MCI2393049.1 EF-hand domain-containing protein [Aliiroseovarius sediminis]
MTAMKAKTATAIALALGAALTFGATSAVAFGGKDARGMQGMGRGFMQMEFTDLDIDANGQITAEDLKAHAEARFSAADTDGDGELSIEEMQAQRAAKMAERQAKAGNQGKGQRQTQSQGKEKGPMAEKRMRWMMENMIAKRDSNGNGTLSLDEVAPDQARMDRMIDRFDTDDDNALSQAEFDAAQKEAFMRGKGKRGHGKGGHGKGGYGKRNGG